MVCNWNYQKKRFYSIPNFTLCINFIIFKETKSRIMKEKIIFKLHKAQRSGSQEKNTILKKTLQTMLIIPFLLFSIIVLQSLKWIKISFCKLNPLLLQNHYLTIRTSTVFTHCHVYSGKNTVPFLSCQQWKHLYQKRDRSPTLSLCLV